MTKVIWIVQGYETKDDEGRMTDVVSIEVYAKNEEEALTKCRKYIVRNGYRVSQVIEK